MSAFGGTDHFSLLTFHLSLRLRLPCPTLGSCRMGWQGHEPEKGEKKWGFWGFFFFSKLSGTSLTPFLSLSQWHCRFLSILQVKCSQKAPFGNRFGFYWEKLNLRLRFDTLIAKVTSRSGLFVLDLIQSRLILTIYQYRVQYFRKTFKN